MPPGFSDGHPLCLEEIVRGAALKKKKADARRAHRPFCFRPGVQR